MIKIIKYVVIIITSINFSYGQKKFELYELIKSVDGQLVTFLNIILTKDNRVVAGTNIGQIEISNGLYKFISNTSGFVYQNPEGDLESTRNSKLVFKNSDYSYLFRHDYNSDVNHSYVLFENALYIINKGRLYVFVECIFDQYFRGKSIRSITDNYIASYSGIYTNDEKFSKKLDIKSDSYIREFDDELFICYNGLALFKENLLTLFRNEKEQTVIAETNLGFSKDILKINNGLYLLFTTQGVYETDLNKYVKSIILTENEFDVLNVGSYPKNIHFYNKESSNKRVLFYINKSLNIYYIATGKTERIFDFNEDIIDLVLYQDELFYLNQRGLYNYNRGKPYKILNNTNGYHTFLPISNYVFILTSNEGAYKYEIEKASTFQLLNKEFNRLAMYKKNDTLYLGGIDGIYKSGISSILSFQENSKIEASTASDFSLKTLIFIFTLLTLVLIIIIVKLKNRKIEYIDKDEILKLDIDTFIEDNISKITVQMIQNKFGVSYRKLTKLTSPISAGKIIENKRKRIAEESIRNGEDFVEISKKTGYSKSYSRLLLKKWEKNKRPL